MANLIFIPLEKEYEAQRIDNVTVVGRDKECTEIYYVPDGEDRTTDVVENIGGYWKVEE